MKYAIIETGGKQYKVKEGDTIEVERLEAKQSKIKFDKVVAVSTDSGFKAGTPYIKGANVAAEIIEEKKAKKVISFKYKRRKSSSSKRGHRQIYTKVKIGDISEA
ncbi:MAG: 50S ribosomal protein L21 [Candidatus Saelkia tenebricola]|nr:50S ribosomal protein L21 [Candidatus Saelkia tenebricola]